MARRFDVHMFIRNRSRGDIYSLPAAPRSPWQSNTWAISLVNAIKDAGAEVALNLRIPAPVFDEAFEFSAVKAKVLGL